MAISKKSGSKENPIPIPDGSAIQGTACYPPQPGSPISVDQHNARTHLSDAPTFPDDRIGSPAIKAEHQPICEVPSDNAIVLLWLADSVTWIQADGFPIPSYPQNSGTGSTSTNAEYQSSNNVHSNIAIVFLPLVDT